MMVIQKRRPTGVTLIGILDSIAGIIAIFAGLSLAAMGWFLLAFPEEFAVPLAQASNFEGFDISTELVGSIFIGIGIILLGLGATLVLAAFGTFGGKHWAQSLNVALALIFIAAGGIIMVAHNSEANGLIIGSLISSIAAVILYYLYRPLATEYFGKIVSQPTAVFPVTVDYALYPLTRTSPVARLAVPTPHTAIEFTQAWAGELDFNVTFSRSWRIPFASKVPTPSAKSDTFPPSFESNCAWM